VSVFLSGVTRAVPTLSSFPLAETAGGVPAAPTVKTDIEDEGVVPVFSAGGLALTLTVDWTRVKLELSGPFTDPQCFEINSADFLSSSLQTVLAFVSLELQLLPRDRSVSLLSTAFPTLTAFSSGLSKLFFTLSSALATLHFTLSGICLLLIPLSDFLSGGPMGLD
jgi:hypothetical protein